MAANAYLDGVHRHLGSLIDTSTIELPAIPRIAGQIVASFADSHADTAALADLIGEDPALSARILRVVNSPSFRGAAEIDDLRQASARMGLDRVRAISLAASVTGALLKTSVYSDPVEDALHRGICSGLWAKELARAVRANPEMAYLCGLLHNVGDVVVLNAVAELSAEELPERDLQELVDALGPAAGRRLGQHWDLPSPVVLSIGYDDEVSTAGADANALAVVLCGAFIADSMLSGVMIATEIARTPAAEHLGLDADGVGRVIAEEDEVRLSLEALAID